MNRGTRRREFLRQGALAAGAVACGAYLPHRAAGAAAADSQIEVLLDEPLGLISPNIYGHFVEHLGGVIYDGVWVGENSRVPNVKGIRKRLIEELQKIHAPVIRYPGGCFADSYDWRDGVGPAEKRPRRMNFWADADTKNAPSAHKYEPNQFGTNEFNQFCRLVGCQPYLAANLRSLPPEEFARWVEYCNAPAGSTTLAEMRAAAGFPEPLAFVTGAWATNRGVAAAISRRRNMPWSSGGSPPGCRSTGRSSRSWLRVRIRTNGNGRGDFSRSYCARARSSWMPLRTVAASLCVEPGARENLRLGSSQGRRIAIRSGGLVRVAARRTAHRDTDRTPLADHGRI